MELQAEDMPRATGEEIVAAIKQLDRETDERQYSTRRVAGLLGVCDSTVRAHAGEWGLVFHHVEGFKCRHIGHVDLVRWLKLRPEFDFALKEVEEAP